MELGISTSGEVALAHAAGRDYQAGQRVQELLALAKRADGVGLDVVAVGEHHRPDFVASAPEVILGAMAAVTQRVRLSSAVTVLSSADPVRTFQNFATVDLISGGRAEIMAGRGSFIESFPLFGYDLRDYDTLFVEKLNLLLKNQRQRNRVVAGQAPRADLKPGRVPAPGADQVAHLDRGRRHASFGGARWPAGAAAHGLPSWEARRRSTCRLPGSTGPLFVGSVREIVDKLLYLNRLFGNTRFLAQLILEGISPEQVLRSVELFGTQVAPAVREVLAEHATV